MTRPPLPFEEWFSDADRMLDPAEASTERYLRARTMVDRDTGRLYDPRFRGEADR